jgi:ectoine hydroxylase-related dioxygenase (phytanoyl-CoA dioxygenase family)
VSEVGGDAACWLTLVCERCGALVDNGDAHRCDEREGDHMTTVSAPPKLLDDETVETFRRDGFVVIHGLLTEAELDHYGAVVTEAVRQRTSADQRPLAEKSRYQQSFLQCMNLWEDHPAVRPLTFHPKLGQAAAELMGVDVVRLWHDQALYKQAGGRPTDAHQDHPYWPMKETNSCTAWIAFEGSTREAGAMAYLPGSHLIGKRKFINIFVGEPEDILADPEVASIEPVLVEVPKGSVAFHHGLTVHYATANTTDRDRAVHTVIYFPDGNTRSHPSPHFAVERPGIPIGAPIRSDVTPVVWPRRPGDLPPTPAGVITLVGDFTNPGAIPEPH